LFLRSHYQYASHCFGRFLGDWFGDLSKNHLIWQVEMRLYFLIRLAQELQAVKAKQKILFIFGPEGGISPKEIEAFEQAGGIPVGLGPRILRTETAPLYALSAVSYAVEMNQEH